MKQQGSPIKSPCGLCNPPLETYPNCSLCQQPMCPSHTNYKGGFFCSKCTHEKRYSFGQKDKDAWGRVLDPLSGASLTTCYCGGLMIDAFNPCQVSNLQGNPYHAAIIPGKTLSQVNDESSEIMQKLSGRMRVTAIPASTTGEMVMDRINDFLDQMNLAPEKSEKKIIMLRFLDYLVLDHVRPIVRARLRFSSLIQDKIIDLVQRDRMDLSWHYQKLFDEPLPQPQSQNQLPQSQLLNDLIPISYFSQTG